MKKEQEVNKPKKVKKYFFYLGILVLFLLLFVIINGVFLYKESSQNDFSSTVANYLPYPAALVNNELLSFEELNNNFKVVKYFQDNQLTQNENYQMDEKDIKADVFNKLILNIVIGQLSEKYGVQVAQEEINYEIQNIKSRLSEGDSLEERLQTMYGISENSFVEKSLMPEILFVKLHEEYLENDQIDEGMKEGDQEKELMAQEIIERIKKGESFKDIAKEKSDDEMTKDHGGDLGFFERGEMVPEFEDAAFGLKKGGISDVIKTSYGYHIIKVTDKKTEDGVEKVKASHILLKTEDNYQQWINSHLSNLKVVILLRGFEWDGEKVVAK